MKVNKLEKDTSNSNEINKKNTVKLSPDLSIGLNRKQNKNIKIYPYKESDIIDPVEWVNQNIYIFQLNHFTSEEMMGYLWQPNVSFNCNYRITKNTTKS